MCIHAYTCTGQGAGISEAINPVTPLACGDGIFYFIACVCTHRCILRSVSVSWVRPPRPPVAAWLPSDVRTRVCRLRTVHPSPWLSASWRWTHTSLPSQHTRPLRHPLSCSEGVRNTHTLDVPCATQPGCVAWLRCPKLHPPDLGTERAVGAPGLQCPHENTAALWPARYGPVSLGSIGPHRALL